MRPGGLVAELVEACGAEDLVGFAVVHVFGSGREGVAWRAVGIGRGHLFVLRYKDHS